MGNIKTRGFDVRDRVPELRRDLAPKVPYLRCPGDKWGVGGFAGKGVRLETEAFRTPGDVLCLDTTLE